MNGRNKCDAWNLLSVQRHRFFHRCFLSCLSQSANSVSKSISLSVTNSSLLIANVELCLFGNFGMIIMAPRTLVINRFYAHFHKVFFFLGVFVVRAASFRFKNRSDLMTDREILYMYIAHQNEFNKNIFSLKFDV